MSETRNFNNGIEGIITVFTFISHYSNVMSITFHPHPLPEPVISIPKHKLPI